MTEEELRRELSNLSWRINGHRDDVIKVSQHDPRVLCYYRWYEVTPVTQKYLLGVVKTLDHEGFVVTAFYTDKIKGGKVAWQR